MEDDCQISKADILKLHWEEFKLRQTHWWSTANKFALLIIAILMLPYVNPTILSVFGYGALGLPIFGLFLSLSASWILGAEYQRVRNVRVKYVELTPSEYRVEFVEGTYFEKYIFNKNIGRFATRLFLIGFSLLCLGDLVMLWSLVSKNPV